MRTIAVTNQKGGCGKTTVSINLAACLAHAGKRVLLVDMDPQGHCALGLSVCEEQIEVSVADVLLQDPGAEPIDLRQAIWQVAGNFDFLPSTLGLVRFETVAANAENRDLRLRQVLAPMAAHYEYCIVDCPPHVGLLTYNALRASGEALVPVETGYFSLQGLQKQLDTIRDLNARTGDAIAIRVLANAYDVRTKLAREILNELRRKYDGLLLNSFVNFNTKLKEGASLGQPITEYDSASMGFRDFTRLAEELMDLEQPVRVHEELLEKANRLAERAEELLACRSASLVPTAPPADTAGGLRPPETPETLERRRREPLVTAERREPDTPGPMQGPRPEPPATVQRRQPDTATAVERPRPEPPTTVQRRQPDTATMVERPRPEPPATVQRRRPEPPAVQPPAAPQNPHQRRARHEHIQNKIDAIYGIRRVAQGVEFNVNLPGAHDVSIAGDFNNWQPADTPMVRQGGNGHFRAVLPLDKGRYRYRLVVDGRWTRDPFNQQTELNEFGELNSVVEIV